MAAESHSSEWVNLEEKVVDNVSNQARNRSLTIAVKGRKGKQKNVKLHIPRGMMPELKRMFNAAFWDGETLDTPAGGASFYAFFSHIVLGTGAAQRTGDAIFVKEVVVRLHVEYSSSLSQVTPVLAAVLDTEPAAGNPNWSDVFQGIGGASTTAYLVAIPDFDERARFRYLKRLTAPQSWSALASISGVSTAATRPLNVTLRIPIHRKVSYNDSAAAPVAGAELHLWGWSDVTSNTPKATASYEIFYEDA